MQPICVAVILAVSLNLVIGFLGELSLGHAAFMSVGAYTGGLLSKFMANQFPGLPVAVRFVTETYQAELEDNAVVKDDAQTAGDVTLKENEKEGGE